MRKLNKHQVISELAKLSNKWIVQVSFDGNGNPNETIKACPILDLQLDAHILFEGSGLILCDNEPEAYYTFNRIVGDDGPTKLNSYNGPVKVYACVYAPTGFAMTENT
jgi:hypothetical protein